MLGIEDKRLALPGGRTLAYADSGNTSSSRVILFLHGAFAVGTAHWPAPSPVLSQQNVHYVAPSLPGWGCTSPVPDPYAFATTLRSDITTLITHLHSDDPELKLYICGHSFGTVSAQILYGSSYDVFPLGRCIAGLLLLAPYSPPHCHQDYTKTMSWSCYFMTGPPALYMPFNLFPRLAVFAMGKRIKDESSTEVFIRSLLFDSMGHDEYDAFEEWREAHGFTDGQLERNLMRNLMKSVARSWRGFLDIPAIYHSGWDAFYPDKLDEEHVKPVLIVASTRDNNTPPDMPLWLAKTLQGATLKVVDGGHMGAMFHMDEIWKQVLDA
ncbi:Alpha/Beta hydrolase protein [Mycena sp. CBHHK59/15]|nr:Alpha/Beta hydrolase protein [Mycena sp. CBHHK59/15]